MVLPEKPGMNGSVVLIFAKIPGLGIAKSRIAATVGSSRAAEIYEELLGVTAKQVLKVPHAVAYTGSEDPGVLRSIFASAFEFIPQQGSDLGHRLRNAFEHLYNRGIQSVVAVGCDCPIMSPDDLIAAFKNLEKGYDVVIGPSEDGGYYLTGCKRSALDIFSAVSWGSQDLLRETYGIIGRNGFRSKELRTLYDIDTMEDYRRWKQNECE